jgi:hypothetical protein
MMLPIYNSFWLNMYKVFSTEMLHYQARTRKYHHRNDKLKLITKNL